MAHRSSSKTTTFPKLPTPSPFKPVPGSVNLLTRKENSCRSQRRFTQLCLCYHLASTSRPVVPFGVSRIAFAGRSFSGSLSRARSGVATGGVPPLLPRSLSTWPSAVLY
jgi:hypothetical protein